MNPGILFLYVANIHLAMLALQRSLWAFSRNGLMMWTDWVFFKNSILGRARMKTTTTTNNNNNNNIINNNNNNINNHNHLLSHEDPQIQTCSATKQRPVSLLPPSFSLGRFLQRSRLGFWRSTVFGDQNQVFSFNVYAILRGEPNTTLLSLQVDKVKQIDTT